MRLLELGMWPEIVKSYTHSQRERETDRQTEGTQTDRHRQTEDRDRQTDRQTDTHTHTHTETERQSTVLKMPKPYLLSVVPVWCLNYCHALLSVYWLPAVPKPPTSLEPVSLSCRPLFPICTCRRSPQPPHWPSGLVVRLGSRRSGVRIPLATGFFWVKSYQWLKNWHSSGYPARLLALLGQRWHWSARCQYTVTGWGRKFDLQLVSQCGSM